MRQDHGNDYCYSFCCSSPPLSTGFMRNTGTPQDRSHIWRATDFLLVEAPMRGPCRAPRGSTTLLDVWERLGRSHDLFILFTNFSILTLQISLGTIENYHQSCAQHVIKVIILHYCQIFVKISRGIPITYQYLIRTTAWKIDHRFSGESLSFKFVFPILALSYFSRISRFRYMNLCIYQLNHLLPPHLILYQRLKDDCFNTSFLSYPLSQIHRELQNCIIVRAYYQVAFFYCFSSNESYRGDNLLRYQNCTDRFTDAKLRCVSMNLWREISYQQRERT